MVTDVLFIYSNISWIPVRLAKSDELQIRGFEISFLHGYPVRQLF